MPALASANHVRSGVTDDHFVAVALLTQRDLNVLGQGFRQRYRVHGAGGFEDLLAQLDDIEPVEAAQEPNDHEH
jgi:hypothetical protein